MNLKKFQIKQKQGKITQDSILVDEQMNQRWLKNQRFYTEE